jgi:hypothetical protein
MGGTAMSAVVDRGNSFCRSSIRARNTAQAAEHCASKEGINRQKKNFLRETIMYQFDSHLSEPTTAGPANENRLRELAKWPGQARSAWRQLGGVDRNRVAWQMAANYGVDFARKFLREVEEPKPKDLVDQYFGRGVGPNQTTLQDRGYRIAQRDSVHEWWVHPSGQEVTRNYEDDPTTEFLRSFLRNYESLNSR